MHASEPTADASLDLTELNETLGGSAVGPADAGWDEARMAWNLAVDQRPTLVVQAVDADDVSTAVAFARDNGLWVSAQATGHGAGADFSLEGAVLIKTGALQELAIDPETRIARVGAGVMWGAVVPAAQEHGLIALAGSSHDVGVVGYHLGGGLSFLGRKHGPASDRVRAIELVKADGSQTRVTAEHEPELFWGLCGGGGNFGIVTALEFELLPTPELHAGTLFFEHERSLEVIEAWRRWSADLPDEMSTDVRMLQFPPLPDLPDPIRGKSFVVVDAIFIGDSVRASELVEPMLALQPASGGIGPADPQALLALHMDPPGPVPGLTDQMVLGELDEGAVAGLVEAVGPGAGVPLLAVELRLLGGSLERAGESPGAIGAIGGHFAYFAVGVLAAPELRAPISAGFGKAREALAGVANGGNLLNFKEARVDPGTAFEAVALARLRDVKGAVDPDNLIRGNHRLV